MQLFPMKGAMDFILEGTKQWGGNFSSLIDNKYKNDFSVLYLLNITEHILYVLEDLIQIHMQKDMNGTYVE